jgi:hypothetical protein
MKMYGKVGVTLQVFSTLVLERGEWSASHSWCFTLTENARYLLDKRLNIKKKEEIVDCKK